MAKTRTKAGKVDHTSDSTVAATAPARKAAKPRAAKLPKAVAAAVDAARDKKAQDLVVLDLRKAGGFTDYFVICTGNNPRQIAAIEPKGDGAAHLGLARRRQAAIEYQ